MLYFEQLRKEQTKGDQFLCIAKFELKLTKTAAQRPCCLMLPLYAEL